MPLYYIKDRATGKPWSSDPRWNDQHYKDKLKPERDRLNVEFCGEKKSQRYCIGTMK